MFASSRPAPYQTAAVAFDGIYRPNADISTGTWTATPSGPLYAAIDEASPPSDLDFITSPVAGSVPAVIGIPTIPSGTQTLRVRAGTSSGTATLTVELLNDTNTVLGTQTAALTSTITTYTLTFSLASPATRVRIGVA